MTPFEGLSSRLLPLFSGIQGRSCLLAGVTSALGCNRPEPADTSLGEVTIEEALGFSAGDLMANVADRCAPCRQVGPVLEALSDLPMIVVVGVWPSWSSA